MRSAIFSFFLLFFFLIGGLTYSQEDTLDFIGTHNRHNIAKDFDLIRKFSWRVSVKYLNGTTSNFTSRKPDTTLMDAKNLDTVHMYTEFQIADSIIDKTCVLQCRLNGSLLLKIDGWPICATGVFGRMPEDKRYKKKDFKVFRFDRPRSTIDIVYLPYKTKRYDLHLKVFDEVTGFAEFGEFRNDLESGFARGFYYFALAIVFLAMFLAFRQRQEYFYFALFCIFAASSYLWEDFAPSALYPLRSYMGVFSFEFLAIFFAKILLNKVKKRTGVIVILVAASFSLIPALGYDSELSMPGSRSSLYTSLTSGILYLYVWGTCITYLIRGVGAKSWEARAILATCLVPIAAYVLVGVCVAINAALNPETFSGNPLVSDLLDFMATAIVYLCPMAGIVILARRNALNHLQLAQQLKSIQHLSEENVAQEKEKKEILERQNEVLEREVLERTAEIYDQKEKIEKQHDELKIEKEKSDELLRNILPAEIAEELKQTGSSAARHFENVTVLFADFVNFTTTGSELTPQALVSELDVCFRAFDQIMVERGIEKIKTIGDAYLAVCGLPVADENHALKVMDAAKAILSFMEQRRNDPANRMVRVRIGVHTGSVVAGIVGVKKFAYDIWGDTVNTAARMQQASDPGKINISRATFERVSGTYSCTPRGLIEVKGKGAMEMYFVD